MIAFLFFAYTFLLLYTVFFAWNHGSSYGPAGPGGRNYNLEPFLSIYNIATYSDTVWIPLRILVGNVILFMPFGFLFPLMVEKFRKARVVSGMITPIILSFLLSVTIEINQFLFTMRVANVDDVILNTLGGTLGVLIYRIMRLIRK
ncbi:VanZ family protein [Paenalkalicoccus suaedae]|uniref:VanZ family protein n=2 Tax=Paenalkalicoccus suaedae TaxID=2592382 RepID=A0A859FKD2_9BACI|nr:VanZ family protein [Paenalkalicoccus suaedae]